MDIRSQYRASLKNPRAEELLDLWLYRPIAFVLARVLAHTGATPNAITAAAIVSAALAGASLAVGGRGGFIAGAILYIVSNILDCCDGMLARIKGNGTQLGRMIDVFADTASAAFVYIGLGIGLSAGTYPLPIPAWALVLLSGTSFALQAALFDRQRNRFLSAHGGASSIAHELSVAAGSLRSARAMPRRMLTGAYLRYMRWQEHDADVAGVEAGTLRLWSFIGSTTHVTVVAVALLLEAPMLLFLYTILAANIWMLLLRLREPASRRRSAGGSGSANAARPRPAMLRLIGAARPGVAGDRAMGDRVVGGRVAGGRVAGDRVREGASGDRVKSEAESDERLRERVAEETVAVLLAAGSGMRLRPLTNDVPKPLVELGGRALLAHSIDALRAAGIRRFVVVAGYRAAAVERFLEREYPGLDVELLYNRRYDQANNAASVLLAARALEGSRMLLLDGDLLYDPAIVADLLARREPGGHLVVRRTRSLGEEEMKVITGPDGAITAIGKGYDPIVCAGESIGIALFDRTSSSRLLASLAERLARPGGDDEFYEASFQQMIDEGCTLGVFDAGDRYCIEIDTPEDLAEATLMLAAERDVPAAA